MSRFAGWLALFLATVVLSGCMHYWTAPLETRIVDAATGQPIADARVAAWPAGRERLAQTFVSDGSGRVDIPSIKFFDPRPGDPGLSYPLALRVEANGYLPVHQSGFLRGGSIELVPAEP